MARPPELLRRPELQKQIADAIATGAIVSDVCAFVGISETAFYKWKQRGKAELERRQNPRVEAGTAQWEREQPFAEFVETITRAEASSRVRAASAIASACMPQKEVHTTTTETAETRLDKDGNPYEYRKAITRTTEIVRPADWRAAVELLKRRDPANWSERRVHQTANEDGELVPIELKWPAVPRLDDGD